MADPIGALRADLSANVAAFQRDMGRAVAAVRSFRIEGTSAGRILSGSAFAGAVAGVATVALQSMARALSQAAAAAVQLGREVTELGAEFEAQMVQMTTTGGLPVEALEEIRRAVFKIGIDTGRPLEQVQAAITTLGSASRSTAEAIATASAAAEAATAGNADLAAVTKALIRVQDAFGDEARDSTEVSRRLFAAMQTGIVTLEEMAGELPKVTTTAAAAGLSMREMFAAVALATKAEEPARAFTALNSVLRSLLQATDDVRAKAREWGREKGIAFDFSREAVQTQGFAEFLRQMAVVVGTDATKLKELHVEGSALATVFKLVGEDAREFNDVLARQNELAERGAENFERVKDTSKNALERMGEAAKTFKVVLFNELLDPWLRRLNDVGVGFQQIEIAAETTAIGIRIVLAGVGAAFTKLEIKALEVGRALADLRLSLAEGLESLGLFDQAEGFLDRLRGQVAAIDAALSGLRSGMQEDTEAIGDDLVELTRRLIELRAAINEARQDAGIPRGGGLPGRSSTSGGSSDAPGSAPSSEGASSPPGHGGSFMEGVSDGINAAREGLRTIGDIGVKVGASLAETFSSAFVSFAMGVQSASDAFKSFARQFILQTIAMIAKAVILAGLQSVISFGAAPAAGASSFATTFGMLLGLSASVGKQATGGQWTVGGGGGTDSQLVAFMATPGERVTVQTPAQQAGGGPTGGVRVVVNNNGPPLRASAASQLGVDGVREIVISTAVDDIARNGPLARALDGHTRRSRGGSNT